MFIFNLKIFRKNRKILRIRSKNEIWKIIREGEEKTMENLKNTFIKFLKDNYKKVKKKVQMKELTEECRI